MAYSKKINCGGSAIVPYVADTGYSSGNTAGASGKSSASATNPAPDGVYTSLRYNSPGASVDYAFSGLPAGGQVKCRFHIETNAANTYRHTVAIDGVTVISAFNPRSVVNVDNRIVIAEATVTVAGSGNISIVQSANSGEYPYCYAIEIDEIADTTAPSDVTGLTIDSSFNIDSNAATDNVGVDHYHTQFKDDTGAWTDYTSTAKTFVGNQGLSSVVGTHTRSIRRKAVDAAGNESANWSDTPSVSYTVAAPPPAPIILTINPTPYAKIGASYSLQLQKTGGSGSGGWSKVSGDGAISTSGLFTINPVPGSVISFVAKFTDANGQTDQKTFTVQVSTYDWISFCHKRPLPRKIILTQRIFTSLSGADTVAEDAAPKYEYSLQDLYIGKGSGDVLRTFLYNHRKREAFYWYNPDRDETRLVKLMSGFDEEEVLAYGGFQIVLRDV